MSVSLVALSPLLLPAAAEEPRSAPIPSEDEVWRKVDSENVTVIGDARGGNLARVAKEIEGFLTVLTAARSEFGRLSKLPTSVFVFRNDDEMAKWVPEPLAGQKNIAGFFAPGDLANVIGLDSSYEVADTKLVYHEYVHHLADLSTPGLPPWLSEGLAEYYSTLEIRGNKAYVGRPAIERLEWLGRKKLIPLDRLFDVEIGDPEYLGHGSDNIFYAQSWALTHLLIADFDDGGEKFSTLLARFREGAPLRDAVLEIYQTPFAELEKRLAAYVRRGQFSYTVYDFRKLELPEPSEPVELTGAPLRSVLGDLSFEVRRRDDATALYDSALALDPKNPRALLGKARLAEQGGDLDAALAALEPLLASGAPPSDAHLLRGRILLTQFTSSAAALKEIGAAPPPEVLEARNSLVQALIGAPGQGRALALLGATYKYQSEGVAPGIGALERSLTASPGNVQARFDLAWLYELSDQMGKAEDTLAEIARTARFEPNRESAERQLTRLRRKREGASSAPSGNEPQAEGKEEGARDSLAWVDAQIAESEPDSEYRRVLEKMRRDIESGSEREAQRLKFNAAAEMASSGKYVEARPIFAHLAENAVDPDLEQRAKVVLKQIDEYLASIR